MNKTILIMLLVCLVLLSLLFVPTTRNLIEGWIAQFISFLHPQANQYNPCPSPCGTPIEGNTSPVGH